MKKKGEYKLEKGRTVERPDLAYSTLKIRSRVATSWSGPKRSLALCSYASHLRAAFVVMEKV